MKRKKIIFLLFAGMLLVLSGAGFSEKKNCFCKQYLKKRINCYGGGIGI